MYRSMSINSIKKSNYLMTPKSNKSKRNLNEFLRNIEKLNNEIEKVIYKL